MSANEGEELWAPHVVDYGYYSALKSGSIDGTDKLPHDHAIVRAMNADYHSNLQVRGDPEKTLFVARLSDDTTEDVLRDAFSKFGSIESCRLVRDIVTGQSRRYGFIEFRHSADMDTAYHVSGAFLSGLVVQPTLNFNLLQEAHDMFLEGSKVIVDYECERLLPGWKPRRFGGGLGGYKESGQLRFGGRERPFKKPITLGSVRLGWKGGGGRREGGARWRGREESERVRQRSPPRHSYGRDSSTHMQRYSRERQ